MLVVKIVIAYFIADRIILPLYYRFINRRRRSY